MKKGSLTKVERNNKIVAMFDTLPGNITKRVRFLADQTGLSEPMIRFILKQSNKIGR